MPQPQRANYGKLINQRAERSCWMLVGEFRAMWDCISVCIGFPKVLSSSDPQLSYSIRPFSLLLPLFSLSRHPIFNSSISHLVFPFFSLLVETILLGHLLSFVLLKCSYGINIFMSSNTQAVNPLFSKQATWYVSLSFLYILAD